MSDRFVIVSDESYNPPTHVVAFVLGPWDEVKQLNNRIKALLETQGKSELKFGKLQDSTNLRLAKEAIRLFLDDGNVRCYVITWNTNDTRHKVRGRDDVANFHRMLFHGLRLAADWCGDNEYFWYPDNLEGLDEEDVRSFLTNTRGNRSLEMDEDLFGQLKHKLRFKIAKQKDSKEVPLIGLADLMAGAVRLSIERGARCLVDGLEAGGQGRLDMEFEEEKVSRKVKNQCQLVSFLDTNCKDRKYGLSLRKENRFSTPGGGRRKIKILHYEPQGDYDKAPTKP